MIITLYWKDIDILTVTKEKNCYISAINQKNFMKANSEGMPLSIFKNYSIVSKKLPEFIENRLPTPAMISKHIDKDDLKNLSIIDYINNTECECATDNFKISIKE